MTKIASGDNIQLHYLVEDDQGNVFSETFSTQPIALVVGSGQLLDTIESQLIGLAQKEKKRFTLTAEQGYGDVDPKRVYIMSRDQFPEELLISEGSIISFATPTGEEIVGAVKDFNEYAVEVDFNHPLAGRHVTVEVEIVKILSKQSASQNNEVS